MNAKPILQIEGLEKCFFQHEQQKTIPSATNIHLKVYPGNLVALVGPTGSGKTSVLKAVYRTYLPSRGRILYRTASGNEEDMATADEHRVLELRKQEIGFVTQFLQALPRQSALDVVAQPLYANGLSREEGRDGAARLLSRLELPERLWSLSPLAFSGGEKQRVNLARGIIAQPRLLLMDEPTASLDPATCDLVATIIQETKAAGTGMLAVLHDPGLVERLADTTIRLASAGSDSFTKEVA
jgi:alpha-D-ribose 1-methylphosphonate 5-triphosphate synthase subunit PhnL